MTGVWRIVCYYELLASAQTFDLKKLSKKEVRKECHCFKRREIIFFKVIITCWREGVKYYNHLSIDLWREGCISKWSSVNSLFINVFFESFP